MDLIRISTSLPGVDLRQQLTRLDVMLTGAVLNVKTQLADLNIALQLRSLPLSQRLPGLNIPYITRLSEHDFLTSDGEILTSDGEALWS